MTAWLALNRPRDWSAFLLLGPLVAIVAASAGLLYWPPWLAYLEREPRQVRIAGWSLVAAAIAGVIVYSAMEIVGAAPIGAATPVLSGGTLVALAGWLLASSPRMAEGVKRGRAGIRSVKARPFVGDFRPLVEGGRASLTILKAPLVFLQITGPWIALLSVGLLAIPSLSSRTKELAWATAGLALILGWLVVFALLIPITGVAWSRWVGQGRRPDRFVALPDRPVLTVMWRLWIFNVVSAAGIDRLSSWLTGHAKAAGLAYPDLFGNAASALLGMVALALAAPFAVRLAARALGDREFQTSDLGPALHRLGLKLGAGLVVAMAPADLIVWALGPLQGLLPDQKDLTSGGPFTVAVLAVCLIFVLAGFASGAAYLTRVYQAAAGPE